MKRESETDGNENGVLVESLKMREKSNSAMSREKSNLVKRGQNGELAKRKERSIKGKTRKQMSFYSKRVRLRTLFILTNLCLYFYIKRHVLILTIVILLFIVLLYFYCLNLRICS